MAFIFLNFVSVKEQMEVHIIALFIIILKTRSGEKLPRTRNQAAKWQCPKGLLTWEQKNIRGTSREVQERTVLRSMGDRQRHSVLHKNKIDQ